MAVAVQKSDMMFGTLDRYIGRSILLTSLLVLLTLVSLASIFAFISELDDVGKGGYTVGRAAQYIRRQIREYKHGDA